MSDDWAVQLTIPAEFGDELTQSRIIEVVQRTLQFFSVVRTEFCPGLSSGSAELTITSNLVESVRSQAGNVVGFEDLAVFGLDRVGGKVVGKTLFRDSDRRESVILLDASLFRGAEEPLPDLQMSCLAHEAAHALIGQLRAAGGGPPAFNERATEVCWHIACFAFEEYQADRLASLAVTTLDHDGASPGAAAIVGNSEMTAIAEAFETMVDKVDVYRVGGCSLEQMWTLVQSHTSQVLNALSHAQANRDAAEELSSVAAELDPGHLLRIMWDPLVPKIRSLPGLGSPPEFVAAEREVLGSASSALLAMWEGLGLTFEQTNDEMWINVAPPE